MARRIRLGDYGISNPLKPEHIGKASHAVLTVMEVDERVPITDETGDRIGLVIRFEEFPDLGLWPNKTGLRYLCTKLGDDVDDWIGEKVPLQKVTSPNPRTHEPADNLWVCKPDEWEKHIAASKQKRTRKKATKRKKGARK